MSTAVMTPRLELDSLADSALKAAARFWFVVAVIGQLVFAFATASFYGLIDNRLATPSDGGSTRVTSRMTLRATPRWPYI